MRPPAGPTQEKPRWVGGKLSERVPALPPVATAAMVEGTATVRVGVNHPGTSRVATSMAPKRARVAVRVGLDMAASQGSEEGGGRGGV
jgi:hypothetical protein